jgi:hypothetical protein
MAGPPRETGTFGPVTEVDGPGCVRRRRAMVEVTDDEEQDDAQSASGEGCGGLRVDVRQH